MAPPHSLAIVGSVTPPGRLRRAVTEGVDRSPVAFSLLDLADVALPFADGRSPADAGGHTEDVVAGIAAAPSVLFATPVYRGSLTGALKNLLDLTPVDALNGKPVALLAMGATPHHFLGAERHLRDLLAFFGAHVTPVAGYLTSRDFEDGAPTGDAAATVDGLLADLERFRGVLEGAGAARLQPLAAR